MKSIKNSWSINAKNWFACGGIALESMGIELWKYLQNIKVTNFNILLCVFPSIYTLTGVAAPSKDLCRKAS